MSTRFGVRAVARLAVSALLCAGATGSPLQAQYFGRNKVQYDQLDFRLLSTEHFRVHFYPAESLAVADAARMAERWYVRHSGLLRHEFSNNPLIFYADAPDFQQSNVIEGEISQGTGGVTEGLRERVIMPLTGSYAETDHVLGHELVHVFQYRIAESSKGGLRAIGNIPLWLIEGMAEYLSLGRDDPNTAMWLRDAVRRNDIPTITQLSRDSRYFPYRYGQAVWAFIGGAWGDDAVARVYRAALANGWEKGVVAALGVSVDTLSARWHTAVRAAYGPIVASRTAPDAAGRGIAVSGARGEQNISPAVSPDGTQMAYFSSRDLFGVDLYLADVASGRVIRRLTSVTTDAHFDALSFISSAGSWSPDGSKLAFVVYARGDQELNIVDVRSGHIERRIAPAGVGAMADPAWSPDGRRIAFSGLTGGISDLYVVDLETGTTTRLTDDRQAQLQPAWSPDGTTLAFVTDAGNETNVATLQFGPMRLALINVQSRAVQLIPRIAPGGKQINPQFSPDGRALLFVSDQDGISDIYRMTLPNGDVQRLTSVSTGVSGITSLSPAISVARTTGTLLFSVFDQQGFSIRALDLSKAVAQVAPATNAGILPPSVAQDPFVSRYLQNATNGLPAPRAPRIRPYSPSLRLDYIGGPQVGVTAGGGYGAGVVGGIALAFSDELGNQSIQTVLQAQGDIRDFGGQALYLNRTHRWNWGASVSHIPVVGGFANYENIPISTGGQTYNGFVYTRQLFRQYLQSGQLLTQYPLSSTRRIEFSAGGQRIAFSQQVDSVYSIGNTVVRETRNALPSASALTFATGSAAFVGDYSFFGFTSPVAGGRYRFEVTPNFGTLNFTTALADYRRYLFMKPVTFAVRALHLGRYGSGADSDRLQQLFLGQPSLLRGYDANSFQASECSGATSSDCPEFSRLTGSRMAVASAELRIPLFGNEQFGLIPLSILPLEIAPFVDGGVAWSRGDDVSFRFVRNSAERVPVFSAGVTARANVLGYAVLEVFWAKPFQRPQRGGVWGFQLQPGW